MHCAHRVVRDGECFSRSRRKFENNIYERSNERCYFPFLNFIIYSHNPPSPLKIFIEAKKITQLQDESGISKIERQSSDRESMRRKAAADTPYSASSLFFCWEYPLLNSRAFIPLLWHSLCLTIQVLSWDWWVEAQLQRELSGLG